MTLSILLQIIAISAGFLVQTIFGFAASLIAYPVLLYQMTLPESVALMSIFYVLFSIIQVKKDYNFIDKKIIQEMLIGIVVGLVVGVSILRYTDPQILKKLLGVFILLFVVYSLWQKKKVNSFDKMGQIFGFGGGLFSGLFAAGGPLLIMYIYNKLNKGNQIRATVIGALAIINFLRAPLLIESKILTKTIFINSLHILPFFLLSIYLGQKVFPKIKSQNFKKALLVILGLVSINLLL